MVLVVQGPQESTQLHAPARVRAVANALGEHLLRYYGWYSNKTRGQRARRPAPAGAGTGIPARPTTAPEVRKGWGALIKQVYESDPICCPKCGSEMKIIAFIERHQTGVIEKILRHCGLWDENRARGPPVPEVSVED